MPVPLAAFCERPQGPGPGLGAASRQTRPGTRGSDAPGRGAGR